MASEEDLSTSLDSVLARTLTDSNASAASTPQDAVMLALHASLLSAGYVCVAIGDEVSFNLKAYNTDPLVVELVCVSHLFYLALALPPSQPLHVLLHMVLGRAALLIQH